MSKRILSYRGLSFWDGFSSVMDIFGEANLPKANTILSGAEADRIALQGDLQRIGGDFQKAIATEIGNGRKGIYLECPGEA